MNVQGAERIGTDMNENLFWNFLETSLTGNKRKRRILWGRLRIDIQMDTWSKQRLWNVQTQIVRTTKWSIVLKTSSWVFCRFNQLEQSAFWLRLEICWSLSGLSESPGSYGTFLGWLLRGSVRGASEQLAVSQLEFMLLVGGMNARLLPHAFIRTNFTTAQIKSVRHCVGSCIMIIFSVIVFPGLVGVWRFISSASLYVSRPGIHWATFVATCSCSKFRATFVAAFVGCGSTRRGKRFE